MPSKSENYGHAIIEALIMGKPVITSAFTPWKNLKITNAGINVDCNENSISTAIQQFVQMDQSTYERWSIGAIEYAKHKIDFEKLHQQYRSLFFNSN
jgi:glycosyltransferase involved in cell wall biosynthesis